MTEQDHDFAGDRRDPGDDELDRRLAALTRESAPREAAWGAIRARIDERPASRTAKVLAVRRWIPAAAAAALVLVAGVAVLDRPINRDPAGPPAVDRARLLVQAEAEAMRRAAPTTTGGIETATSLVEAWADNEAAIEQLEAALDRDPDNYLLLEFLAEARLRQVRLLNSGLGLSPPTDA